MYPTESSQPKRKRGAQPGNHNACKKPAQSVGAGSANCAPPSSTCERGKPAQNHGRQARKRGAPLGNQNALTHGFYARRLPQSQLDGLEETTVRSLEDEIGVMRVFSRKVAELGAEVDELDEAKSILNALSLATGSINRLVRTHTHIPALELDPSAMLRQALMELQLEWPELRKFGHQFRTPEEIEAIEEEATAYMAAHPELNQDEPGNA